AVDGRRPPSQSAERWIGPAGVRSKVVAAGGGGGGGGGCFFTPGGGGAPRGAGPRGPAAWGGLSTAGPEPPRRGVHARRGGGRAVGSELRASRGVFVEAARVPGRELYRRRHR